jgi:hypothetical protein
METSYTIRAKVWVYPSEFASWYFLTIPKKQSQKIKSSQHTHKAFGSISVEVTLGHSIWKTSIFPSKEGVYILPLKASVRKKERVYEGDTVKVALCV